jgi:hypothetical protein
VLGTLARSRSADGPSTTSLTADLSLGQLLPGLFSLEGRLLWAESDGKQTYLRYTGIVRGYDFGRVTATAELGDLIVRDGQNLTVSSEFVLRRRGCGPGRFTPDSRGSEVSARRRLGTHLHVGRARPRQRLR